MYCIVGIDSLLLWSLCALEPGKRRSRQSLLSQTWRGSCKHHHYTSTHHFRHSH